MRPRTEHLAKRAWGCRAANGLPETVSTVVDKLAARTGGLSLSTSDLSGDRPELGAPVDGTERHLAADIVYMVTYDDALHVLDVFASRP